MCVSLISFLFLLIFLHCNRLLSRHSIPQVEQRLAAAQAELEVAKHEVATRDQTSAESKSQAEASAARLQVEIARADCVFEMHDVVLADSGAAAG